MSQTINGREMFHQMLNSRPNPERAYALLTHLAAAAAEPRKDAKPTERANRKSNLRDLAEYLHATGRGHELIAALDAILSAREQEGGEEA